LDVASLRAYAVNRRQLAPYEPLRDVVAGVAQLRRNVRTLAGEVERKAELLPESLVRETALDQVEAALRIVDRAIGGDLATAREVSWRLVQVVNLLADSLRMLGAAHE
jgi:hypothetical protein